MRNNQTTEKKSGIGRICQRPELHPSAADEWRMRKKRWIRPMVASRINFNDMRPHQQTVIQLRSGAHLSVSSISDEPVRCPSGPNCGRRSWWGGGRVFGRWSISAACTCLVSQSNMANQSERYWARTMLPSAAIKSHPATNNENQESPSMVRWCGSKHWIALGPLSFCFCRAPYCARVLRLRLKLRAEEEMESVSPTKSEMNWQLPRVEGHTSFPRGCPIVTCTNTLRRGVKRQQTWPPHGISSPWLHLLPEADGYRLGQLGHFITTLLASFCRSDIQWTRNRPMEIFTRHDINWQATTQKLPDCRAMNDKNQLITWSELSRWSITKEVGPVCAPNFNVKLQKL